MTQALATPSRGVRDSAFGAVATAVFGLVMMETGCILLKSTTVVHIVNLLVGTVLISLSLRRFLQYWPSAKERLKLGRDDSPQTLRLVIVTACILIGGGGYIAADTLAYGLVFPFTLFVIGLVLLPWTRMAQTRMHCLGYWTAAALGVGLALLANHSRLHPVFPILVSCFLWMSTCVSLLRLVIDEKQGRPRDASRTEASLPRPA